MAVWQVVLQRYLIFFVSPLLSRIIWWEFSDFYMGKSALTLPLSHRAREVQQRQSPRPVGEGWGEGKSTKDMSWGHLQSMG